MSTDPLRVVWDALEARGCRPRGKPWDFRARCPVHGAEGGNPHSLHVQVGADDRAVLWCFARQCPVEAITDALGLSVSDLYPDGHDHARRRSLRPLRRSDFSGPALSAANVLHGLEQLGMSWQLMFTSVCPYCGSPGAWLRATSKGYVLGNGLASEGRVDADCPEGCTATNYVQALRALTEKEESR